MREFFINVLVNQLEIGLGVNFQADTPRLFFIRSMVIAHHVYLLWFGLKIS